MGNPKREHWGSKIGFILAAAGSAVGLGNMWRFPYVAGEYGGAAFILIYLACILLMGLPIMYAELVIGRHTEKDPVGAFKEMSNNGSWQIVGYIGVLSGFLILSFYSVIGGWTLGYIVKSVQGIIGSIENVDAAKKIHESFVSQPGNAIIYHFLFLAACVFIVIKGITNGIERWSKILMPILFVLLIILIVKGISMPGGMQGVEFMLAPDFSKINLKAVINALGQSFFTLSLGMGAILTYGSYLSKKDNILSSGAYIVVLDTFVALMAGLAIFPAVFAMGMKPDAGPSLIFYIIPAVFGKMEYGLIFSVIFFSLLFIAALTSGMSLLEVVAAYVIDEKGWKRWKAVTVFGFIIFLLGVPSALSFGILSADNFSIMGKSFFDLMDGLTTNFMLPIGALLMAVFLGWRYGLDKTMHELDNDTESSAVKQVWAFTLRFISPVLLVIYFVLWVIYA